jgi:hypothetical protein
MMEGNYEVGDVITTKKQHPCGSNEWKILRVGAEFRIKCLGCGHQLMLPRSKVIAMIRKKSNESESHKSDQETMVKTEIKK